MASSVPGCVTAAVKFQIRDPPGPGVGSLPGNRDSVATALACHGVAAANLIFLGQQPRFAGVREVTRRSADFSWWLEVTRQ